jgi:AspT/YidE/YbjL antiporter-like protein
MIDFLLHALQAHPEVAIFLSIALGTLIGRLHFGFFHLGSVAGSLLAGLLIGQLGVDIPALLKSVFFAMFIYAVGFKSGPEFFGSLNRGTLKLVLLAAFLCVVGLGCILLMSHVFGFDQGFAVGLGAGALTDTAMLGTGSGALNALPLDAAQIRELNSHMAVSYAITYLIGTIGMILFVGAAAPRLLKVNLKAAAREFEAQLAGGSTPPPQDQVSLYTQLVTRALRIAPDAACLGQTIGQVEQAHAGVSIERVLRAGRVLDRELSLVLAAGDIVGVAAQRSGVATLHRAFGDEVDEPLAMSYPAKTAEVVLTRSEFAGRSLREIREMVGPVGRHGVFLTQVQRQGLALPLLDGTVFRRAGARLAALAPPAVGRLSQGRAMGLLRIRSDGVRRGGGPAGRAEGDARDAGERADPCAGWPVRHAGAADPDAVLRPLRSEAASDVVVRRPGRRADRGCCHEHHPRGVAKPDASARLHRQLCRVERAAGGVGADHRGAGLSSTGMSRRCEAP